jgi:MFS family permease
VPLITRFGQRAVLRGGLVLLLAGMLWLARLPADATYLVDVGPGLLLIGIGAGLTFPSTVGLAMSGATNADAGLASGLVNTTRMVGGSLGLAVMASLLTSRVGTLTTTGADLGTAVTGGAQLAMSFAAVLIVAALVVSVTVLRQSMVTQDRPADQRTLDAEVLADAA